MEIQNMSGCEIMSSSCGLFKNDWKKKIAVHPIQYVGHRNFFFELFSPYKKCEAFVSLQLQTTTGGCFYFIKTATVYTAHSLQKD